MKARVKATGEIVEVDIYTITKRGKMFGEVTDSRRLCKPDSTFRKFYRDEIEFLSYEDTPDYWTHLEHQYAGMAMQSYVSNNVYLREIREMCKEPQEMRDLIADLSILLATTLIQKLKKKEERK